MIKIFIAFLVCANLFAQTNEKQINIWESKNIWIKSYTNNRNYMVIINNIVKLEQKIKKFSHDLATVEKLKSRLKIQKSKLELYESNKNFEAILLPYRYTTPSITIHDYIFKDSLHALDEKIDKFTHIKNEFYIALSLLNGLYQKQQQSVSKNDVEYFEDYSENIEKTLTNLIEAKDDLKEKYSLYRQEKLQKHVITAILVSIIYLSYKVLSLLLLYIERKMHTHENEKNYKKVLSIIFFIVLCVFLIVRYLNDVIYIITFLSVVAAGLTIALREIILNLVGSLYIFFSNILRIGDRIMIQFETKHTIGDIVDISLMKIKLNEIEDYTNIKDIKNVGRTIYIPNSYVFTKVFYNYSRKKDGLINDLIEFEFTPENDFDLIKKVTEEYFSELGIDYKLTFTLNNLKTGIVGLISYHAHYKRASAIKSEISVNLFKLYSENEEISLKNSKKNTVKSEE